MRLPPGIKLRGGFRLPRMTKTGRVEVPGGAFGQSAYQKLVRAFRRLEAERPDQPETTLKNIEQ